MKKQTKDLAAKEFFVKGYYLQRNGDLDTAIHNYKMSISFNPTAQAHTFLGEAYGMQGKYREAIRECLTAIYLDEEFGNPYNDIGSYLICIGDYDEAEFWLKEAVSNPHYNFKYYSYFNLGGIYEIKGDWIEALKFYRKALKINPGYDSAEKSVYRLTTLLN